MLHTGLKATIRICFGSYIGFQFCGRATSARGRAFGLFHRCAGPFNAPRMQDIGLPVKQVIYAGAFTFCPVVFSRNEAYRITVAKSDCAGRTRSRYACRPRSAALLHRQQLHGIDTGSSRPFGCIAYLTSLSHNIQTRFLSDDAVRGRGETGCPQPLCTPSPPVLVVSTLLLWLHSCLSAISITPTGASQFQIL